MIYLDNNSTTRPCAEASDAISRAVDELWANPSSVHRAGQAAKQAVELARADVAALLNARPRDLVFTSGGTESLISVIRGVVDTANRAGPAPTIISTPIEHAAIRDTLEQLGDRVRTRMIPVLPGGVLDAAALDDLLPATGDEQPGGRVSLVIAQWANNETGAIQPVEDIWQRCRDHGVPFLCDATQWAGKMPITPAEDVGGPPCDMLVCAPHKFHGTKGVGVLWTRRGVRIPPLLPGSQELGRRGGTENVPGILAAGAAARAAAEWLADPARREAIAALRDRFERRILDAVPAAVVNAPVPDAQSNRSAPSRLWNTSSLGFPPLEAEALLLMLSERGVCASAGAACSSGSLEPSPVLLAMGIPESIAHGSLRFSLSRDTTADEINRAAEVVIDSVAVLARAAGAMS